MYIHTRVVSGTWENHVVKKSFSLLYMGREVVLSLIYGKDVVDKSF